VFPAPDGGVSAGGAVQLDGQRVGSVRSATLRYEPDSGRLAEQVTIAITPSRVALPAGQSWQPDPRTQMNAMLRRLIAQGLRAEIGSSVPVVGGKIVNLAFVPGTAPAELGSGPVPLIPTGPSGDITGIMKSVAGVAAKLQALPLDQIAADVRRASANIATLTGSPKLAQSVARLDATLANAEAMTRSLRAATPPLLAALRRASAQAASTLAAAHTVISGGYLGGGQSAGIPSTLYELSRAARSLRQLADYLDRHPEALISGRSGGR
jgi:paraquat-inducible protein B